MALVLLGKRSLSLVLLVPVEKIQLALLIGVMKIKNGYMPVNSMSARVSQYIHKFTEILYPKTGV